MPQARTTKLPAKRRAKTAMPVRGANLPALKLAAQQANKTPRWKVALMSLLGLGAAGCTQIDVVNLPPAQGPMIYNPNDLAIVWPVDPWRQQRMAADLQLCTNHIASGLQRDQGQAFNMLRLDSDTFLDQPWHGFVGGVPVARVHNGTGQWYGGLPGRAQYRKITFHCLQAGNGAILYSYVRPQY